MKNQGNEEDDDDDDEGQEEENIEYCVIYDNNNKKRNLHYLLTIYLANKYTRSSDKTWQVFFLNRICM